MTMENPNIDGGWAWVVLGASFSIHAMIYGMAWSTGVYNVIFLGVFQQPESVTAWVCAMPTAMMYAAGPLSSTLTKKFGFRPVLMFGGLMSGVGLVLSYFAPILYYLFFSFGLAGFGFGMSFIPAITAVAHYFEKRVTLAVGIAASGVGVGNCIYPVIIRFLINVYDWRFSLLILGGFSFTIILFGALVRPTDRPMEDRPVIDITLFKKRCYIVLCINNFLWCCGISALYIHLTALSESESIDADRSAYLISGLGIANVFGRFAYGVLGQNRTVQRNFSVPYGISFCLGGVCLCVLPFVKAYQGLMCIAVLFGLFSGSFGTMLVPLQIQLFGRHRLAHAYGCLLLFEAAGQFLGGPLAGFVFDQTQSYMLSFVLGGVLCIASAIIMIYPYLYVRMHAQEQEQNVPEQESLASSVDVPLNMAEIAM